MSWPIESDRDRRALVRRGLRLVRERGVVSIGGEPGAGVRWVARAIAAGARGAIVVESKPRARTRAIVIGGADPDLYVAPFAAPRARSPLLEAWLAQLLDAAPFVTETFSAASIEALALAADGLPGALVRIAERAARLGVSATLELCERGAVFPIELDRRDARAVAGLAIFEAPATREEVEAALDGRVELDGLVSRSLVRASSDGFFYVSRHLAHAARQVANDRTLERSFSRWGRALYEDAIWIGKPEAMRSLARHRDSFARIGRRAIDGPLDESLANALIAWNGSSEPPAVLEAVRVATDALARAGSSASADLALAVAESARIAGMGGPTELALTVASKSNGATKLRADLIAARLFFNRSALEDAIELAGSVRARATKARDRTTAALALLTSAWALRERGLHDRARSESRLAREELTRLGGALHTTRASMNEALIDIALGHSSAAIELLATERERTNDESLLGSIESFLCVAYELAGAHELAERAIESALARPAPPLFVGIWQTYHARVALARGRVELARDLLARSRGRLEELGAAASVSTAFAFDAVAHAWDRDFESAGAALTQARRLAKDQPRARGAIVQLAASASDFLRASAPIVGEPLQLDRASFIRAVRRSRPKPIGTDDSFHLRTAFGAIEAIVDSAIERARDHERLVLDAGGARFRGAVIALDRRPVLARLLHAFASHREAASADELVGRTWPGERIARNAALNRLRVAIAELRELGLRDAIEHTGAGYRLRADLEVAHAGGKAGHEIEARRHIQR